MKGEPFNLGTVDQIDISAMIFMLQISIQVLYSAALDICIPL